MPLTIRNLVEILDEIDLARKEIEMRRQSIALGGNAITMAMKNEALTLASQRLENLLNSEITV